MESGYKLRSAGGSAWEAVLGVEVVGSARTGSEGLEVFVAPAHRRKGIGRCLVRAVVSDLMKRGVESVTARTEDQAGRAFLESLGGQPLGEGRYGWRDLSAVAKCAS